jgi:hypothetical protein
MLSTLVGVACAQQPTSPPRAARALAATSTMARPGAASTSREPELKWGPAPAIFPAGAEMAVLQGDPGFVTAPANHAHYAAARGLTVVQVHAIAPFAMTYVNPADTPPAARR